MNCVSCNFGTQPNSAGKCVSGCTDPTIFEVKSHRIHAVNRGNCNMNNAMYLTAENGDRVQSTCPDDEPTPNLVRALSATRQRLCAGCGRESQKLGRAVRSREVACMSQVWVLDSDWSSTELENLLKIRSRNPDKYDGASGDSLVLTSSGSSFEFEEV